MENENMDEVLEKFQNVLGREAKDEPKTNFDGMYKNWGKLGNQEERRKEILNIQKGNRNDKLDKFRGILELMNAVEENEIFKSHPRTYYRPNIYVAGFNKASPTYSNVLMMSEWIIEKPEDFNENWYVVPCPKGVRMLVVANQEKSTIQAAAERQLSSLLTWMASASPLPSNITRTRIALLSALTGSTKCYTKYGHFRFQASTALPGGHRQSKKSNQCCVLDCFYNEKINTMFILDLLAWNNQPFTDGETEFRHYWLQTQLPEIPGLEIVTKRNEVLFKLLPKTPCDPESFEKFMMAYPPFEQNFPPLDGLLFYHKRAHYVSGQTPLVGWLFPFMVPEVLGAEIKINKAYAIEKPENYVDQKDFIEKFEAKHEKKNPRKAEARSRSCSNAMDDGEGAHTQVKPKRLSDPAKKAVTTETMESEAIPFRPPEKNEDSMESTQTKPPEKEEEIMDSDTQTKPPEKEEEIMESETENKPADAE